MATGINFCCTALSAALSATVPTCTANLRGEAKLVTCAWAAAKPCACKLSLNDAAKLSPNAFNAFGGNSSTNNSTNKFFTTALIFRKPSSYCSQAVPILQRHATCRPWENPDAHDCRDNFAPHCGRDCECGRYTRRA